MSVYFVQVETTLPTKQQATRIARAVVKARLAACAQVSGPVASTYRWQGRVETAREWLVVAKTIRARVPAIRAAIEDLHPYDTPQVTVVPITCAAPRYAAWLTAAVTPGRPVRRKQ